MAALLFGPAWSLSGGDWLFSAPFFFFCSVAMVVG